DRVADEDGRRELPVLAQEYAARSRQVGRHERVKETRGQAALDVEAIEFRLRDEAFVVVQRVEVAGNLRVLPDVVAGQRQAARRAPAAVNGIGHKRRAGGTS